MDLEKIKAVREKQAEEFRYAQQTAKIVTAIKKQTETLSKKFDELIDAVKASQKVDGDEEASTETLTS